VSVGGRGTPVCVWSIGSSINYTHRGLGSELLPDQLGRELLPAPEHEVPF
jgi:hypothetical protein